MNRWLKLRFIVLCYVVVGFILAPFVEKYMRSLNKINSLEENK